MMRTGLRTVAMIAVLIGLQVRAEAQPPCAEFVQLRSDANAVWKRALSAPASERCGALDQASQATAATFSYASDNRVACNVSASLLSQVEGYHREAVQARDNVCAGRPLRPYPADVIGR
jgi:hypothetical protein